MGGQRGGGMGLSRMAVLLLGAAFPFGLGAQELPTGGQVVAGDVTLTNGAGRLDIGQASDFGIIDWTTFGIGAGATVRFDNGSGATLNRVTGGDLSQIMGNLSASGSVYLLNPAGVVIGAGGVVDTGGRFVASTLDATDADFLDGGDLTLSGGGGVVVNLGQVGSSGGDVALIAGDVVNGGSLAAPNGTVALGAGRRVVLRDGAVDGGLLSVEVGGGDVTDRGAIRAAAAELRAKGGNVYALAGNTDAVIAATGVAKVKGRVFLTAEGGKVEVQKDITARDAAGQGGKVTVTGQEVALSGTVRTRAGGEVIVKASGETTFEGMIQTEGGGFIELSGRHITYDGHLDSDGGRVLIDPENIEISNSFILSNATVFTSGQILDLLNSGDLVLDTTVNDNGDAGTIAVFDGLFFDTSNSLTLLAAGDLLLYGSIQNDGSGDVNAVAGWAGTALGQRDKFDPGPLDAEDVGAAGLFGKSSGAVYTIFESDETASGKVQIGGTFGSKNGTTRVYGHDVILDATSGSQAQIGYRASSGSDLGSVGGAITVRATGTVSLQAGDFFGQYAQIGHGGIDFSEGATVANFSGAINVEAAGDLMIRASGAAEPFGTYAMVGHGSLGGFGAAGDASGAVTITVDGETSLVNSDVWIGNVAGGGTLSNAPVTVTTGSIDLSSDNVGSGGSLADIQMWSTLTQGGEVRLTVTNSDLVLQNQTPIPVEGFFTSTNDLIVDVNGLLTLDGSFSYVNAGLGGLDLSGLGIDNVAGSDAFGAIGGGWHLYSTRPEDDSGVLDSLTVDGLFYGTSFDPLHPQGPGADLGNTVHYRVAPEVRVGDGFGTYGDNISVGVLGLYVDGEEVNSDTYGLSFVTLLDETAVTLSSHGYVNAGSFTGAMTASLESSVAGTASGFTVTRGDLTIDRRALTAGYEGFINKTYDATTSATLDPTNFFVLNLAEGDGASVTQTEGTFDSAGVGEKSVQIALSDPSVWSADPGTDLDNYILPAAAETSGLITPAQLVVTITGNPTKLADGTPVATLTPANFTVSGLMGADQVAITRSLGSYDSATAGPRDVTSELSLDDYAALGETDLDNYDLDFLATGTGTITLGRSTPPERGPDVTPDPGTNTDPEPPLLGGGLEVINTETTGRILEDIQAGSDFCREFVDPEYAIDCLSDRLQSVADGLSATGEYSEVRAALEDAAAQLHALAVQNASDALTRSLARATDGSGRSSGRPLTAVDQAALADANAKAAAIIANTQIVLLRSAGNGDRQRVAFTQVGQVLGATTVLLRS